MLGSVQFRAWVLRLAPFEGSMPTKVIAEPVPQGRLQVLEIEVLDNLEAFRKHLGSFQ